MAVHHLFGKSIKMINFWLLKIRQVTAYFFTHNYHSDKIKVKDTVTDLIKGGRQMSLGNKSDQLKGKLKETEGKLTGDKAREAQGKSEKLAGKAKEKIDQAKESAEKKLNDNKDELDHKA